MILMNVCTLGAALQCKHQLAAQLAEALHSYNEVNVSDAAFAQLLISAFIP